MSEKIKENWQSNNKFKLAVELIKNDLKLFFHFDLRKIMYVNHLYNCSVYINNFYDEYIYINLNGKFEKCIISFAYLKIVIHNEQL